MTYVSLIPPRGEEERWAASLSARTAFDLDVERLTQAMDDAYTYALVEDKPDLPFVDDIEGFWHPFAAKVLALLAEDLAIVPPVAVRL